MTRSILIFAFAFTALLGCATTIGVDKSSFQSVYREHRENVLDNGTASLRSRSFLAHLGLDERYDDEPEKVIADLCVMSKRGTNGERFRDLEVLIAELSYELALDTDDRNRFLESAIHAYFYLFGEAYVDVPNPYSPSFRLACDLYNRALARSLLGESGSILLANADFDTPSGKVKIETIRPGFPWDEKVFSTFLPADTFKVRGLRERVRDFGLGVPLIAIQNKGSELGLSADSTRREIKIPATAFLRLSGGLDELLEGKLTGTLELYLSLDESSVQIASKRIPLEADLTAPIAHTLEKSKILDFGIAGFRRGITKDFPTGVFMLQPYQKGKIPLVLFHGTASSPATWAQLINGVLADRHIRARYQVWLGMYNTGNPIVYSASLLRESLTKLHDELDPKSEDAALSNMVLVGHSQGGLVTRLLLTESGDRIWRSVTDKPFESYELDEKTRELIAKSVFFDPVPFASRAVFISTPHRGSVVAGGWIGRLASKLVTLPLDLTNVATGLFKKLKLPDELSEMPTSVDNMNPNNLFVKNLAKLPFKDDLIMHSIVSVKPGKGAIEKGDDGVVEYKSAHLEEAVSELVVRHGHSCQDQPETITELRRILFEHLNAFVLEQPVAVQQ